MQDGSTPIAEASYAGHTDIVKTLIESEADVNIARKVRARSDNLVSGWGVSGCIVKHTSEGFMFSCLRECTAGLVHAAHGRDGAWPLRSGEAIGRGRS